MVREAELHQAAGADDVGYGLAGHEVRGVGCVQRAHAGFGWLPVLGWAGCAVGWLCVGLTVAVSILGVLLLCCGRADSHAATKDLSDAIRGRWSSVRDAARRRATVGRCSVGRGETMPVVKAALSPASATNRTPASAQRSATHWGELAIPAPDATASKIR